MGHTKQRLQRLAIEVRYNKPLLYFFMKTTKLLLAILMPLCFYACGNKSYPHTMQVADTLVYNNPDSTITLLEHLKDSIASEPEATQMYYWLLTIKAEDKAYVKHTSDSLILEVLHYYENKEDEKHLPEAYYYAGRVYSDLEDAPQALNYFQKAAELLEGSTDYRLKKVLYSQMGELFFFQDVYDEAMKAYKKSYYYNKLYIKDNEGIAISLGKIGSTFNFLNNMDSAMFYYQAAYEIAKKDGRKHLIDGAQTSLIDLYTQLGKFDLAIEAIKTLDACKPHEQIALNGIVADLFLQTENLDSATYYYKKLIQIDDIYAQQVAHWGLAEVAQKQSDCQSSLEHLRQYNIWTDSIRKVTDSETIRKAQSFYNYQLREKENLQLKTNNAQQKQLITYSLLAMLLLTFYSIAHIQYNKRKKLQLIIKLEKLEKLKEEQYRKSSQFIEENNRKIEELEKALQSSNANSDDMRKQLQEQKEEIMILNSYVKIDIKKQSIAEFALKQTDIYGKFHSAADNPIILNCKDWEILQAKIDTCYNNFTGRLLAIQSMSDIDMKICLLIKIGISITGISTILDRSKSAIVSARKKMYLNVHGEAGKPEQWDEFIKSL